MIRGRLLSILLASVVLVGFVFSGCAKKPAETAVVKEEAVKEEPAVQLEEGQSVLAVKEVPALADRHEVKKGECLWWIAEYRDIYNDPFQWPVIYDANKDKITNPDLIYPGQVFYVPRGGYTIQEVKKARKRAGAPRPYTPPAEAFVPTR